MKLAFNESNSSKVKGQRNWLNISKLSEKFSLVLRKANPKAELSSI